MSKPDNSNKRNREEEVVPPSGAAAKKLKTGGSPSTPPFNAEVAKANLARHEVCYKDNSLVSASILGFAVSVGMASAVSNLDAGLVVLALSMVTTAPRVPLAFELASGGLVNFMHASGIAVLLYQYFGITTENIISPEVDGMAWLFTVKRDQLSKFQSKGSSLHVLTKGLGFVISMFVDEKSTTWLQMKNARVGCDNAMVGQLLRKAGLDMEVNADRLGARDRSGISSHFFTGPNGVEVFTSTGYWLVFGDSARSVSNAMKEENVAFRFTANHSWCRGCGSAAHSLCVYKSELNSPGATTVTWLSSVTTAPEEPEHLEGEEQKGPQVGKHAGRRSRKKERERAAKALDVKGKGVAKGNEDKGEGPSK